HLLPSIALLTPERYAVRFEISARNGNVWTSWVATATLGDHEFPPMPAANESLTVDVDEVQVTRPADAVRLRVRVAGDVTLLAEAAWLATLSAWDGTPPRNGGPSRAPRLAVPARTQ